jgi:nicotinate-nucleotide adenylyltransferase
MRLALFGGSFDPPHLGHQMAMLYVLATARVDGLLMVPCFRHPFDKRLRAFEHRLAMARLAAQPFGGSVEVSDLERRLGGESRTLNTVKAILAERPGVRIGVVIGADLLAERERWYGYPELARLVDFIVVGRAGHTPPDANVAVAIPDVSSTEIRARLARGDDVVGLVSSSVADYIAAHRLYLEP